MQLVAYGAQDIYLTGNAQITLFKVVYRRHTNFAMESIENVFQGAVGLNKRVTAVIQRNGDLIKDMWLECEFSFSSDTVPVYGLGNAMVKQVEIEIGGQLIDRQYGEWMNIWSELCVPEGKRIGYDAMVGNHAATASTVSSTTGTPGVVPNSNIDVPLWFWFNNNPGLALPLIALQYHEVRLNLELESGANLTSSGTELTLTSAKLWVDYIYLDTDERRRMAQVSHEYLIEQLQFVGNTTATSSLRVDLPLNHPVKELIWVTQDGSAHGRGSGLEPCQFTEMTFTTALLKLNGHDRFTARRPEYFLNVQHFKHHTHMARSGRDTCLVVSIDALDDSDSATTPTAIVVQEDNSQYIYVYSFALNPEDHQPSGTCNFSRIDNATLQFTGLNTNAGTVKVYARNYNVLRIMSGMAGVAYSN